jgi:Domain of unknown function (DUF6484)
MKTEHSRAHAVTGTEDALQVLLHKPRAAGQLAAPDAGAVVIGTLCALNAQGQPLVQWPGSTEPVGAASLVAVGEQDIGRSVALSFPAGATQALLLGLIWSPQSQPVASVEVDGQNLEIAAQESITLRCGKASLTLTADGQILLRGAYISSHSSGTQRIKGAAVRIN